MSLHVIEVISIELFINEPVAVDSLCECRAHDLSYNVELILRRVFQQAEILLRLLHIYLGRQRHQNMGTYF